MMRRSSSGAGSLAAARRQRGDSGRFGGHFGFALLRGLRLSLGADAGGRARVEPGVEKHPGRRRHQRETARRRDRDACPGEAVCGDPRERRQRGAGAIENRDRHGAEDVLPPLPMRQLDEVVATHQPDKSGARKAPAQHLQRVGGVGRAEPGLDIADPDARLGGGDLDAASRRSANGIMPATGFNGFCGETSHHTSSRSSRLSASRLMCRWPPWAGLNEPPRRPMRRPRQAIVTPSPPPGERVGVRGHGLNGRAAAIHPHPPSACAGPLPLPRCGRGALSGREWLAQGRTWPLPRTRYL